MASGSRTVSSQKSGVRKRVDFSGGRRGAVLPPPKGKTRIAIRIDFEVLEELGRMRVPRR
jgi:hypothetical protein